MGLSSFGRNKKNERVGIAHSSSRSASDTPDPSGSAAQLSTASELTDRPTPITPCGRCSSVGLYGAGTRDGLVELSDDRMYFIDDAC